jgi:hypothetical protein
MPHVLIIHEVEAYLTWKAVFDGAADRQEACRRNQLPTPALRRGCQPHRPLLGLVFARERPALLRVSGVGQIEARCRRESAGLSVSGRDRTRRPLARTIHQCLLRRPILSPGGAVLVRTPRRTAGTPASASRVSSPGGLPSRTPRDGIHEESGLAGYSQCPPEIYDTYHQTSHCR